ncbi:long-chain fatty acid--CoA ligase [Nocardia yamanashiensis]|uniref:acyl-CoA synthetase n=1 Tax=Nocardia yamanashiensis TaxID=209247 RepID=UPI001E3CB1FE|nr:long-chain fatty acid--CoA ligase [Nocardia yamanashiensis]UGT41524.1 long-chain fatty acid--CoA ligase [Nocardia yamanashiensis]
MRNRGLGSWPARRARMAPDAVAITCAGDSITYARLSEHATRAAHALRGLGVRAGDRVAYLGPNHPVYLEVFFAAGLLGAVFVPLNTRSTAAELEYALTDSGAAVLVHTGEHDALVTALPGTVTPGIVRVGAAGEAGGYAELLAAAPTEPIDEPVEQDQDCLILYTSGSTGRPKGAVLTHGNLTWNCINVIIETDVATDEATLVAAPLFHAGALGMVCLPTLLKGGRVVLLGKFDPATVLEIIETERITWMFGVPTMFDTLAAHPRWAETDLSSLRILLCGGSPVPHSTIRRYLDRSLSFVQGYGMTEAAPGVLLLDREHAESKLGSAGVPSFFTEVKVVGADGEQVAVGERGEVLVGGPNVMRGYWQRPDATAESLRDGWFHSGDVATVDADGYVFVVDRIKDMIISGGENVYPAEVENELCHHPAVAMCSVIGVPDARWGEVGKAVVVPAGPEHPEAAELLGFLRERLAGFKVPKYLEFVAELPTTGSGKIRKADVKALYGRI